MAGVVESTCYVGVRASYESRGHLVAVVDAIGNITTHAMGRDRALELRVKGQEPLRNCVSRSSAPCLYAQGVTGHLHVKRDHA
jgi:hypothetical protein